nr:unnamed protein product [Digitaria exilis]
MGSVEAPLLLPAPSVEGCPGCVMEWRKANSKGRVPYMELFFVGVTSLASCTVRSSCYRPIGDERRRRQADWNMNLDSVSSRLDRAPLPITCLFPFMYFMVRDFHIAKTEEDIGFYAGFLGIVNTAWALGLIVGPALGGYLAQILSLWAVSDRKYGGLSFSTEGIAEVLSMAGASLLVYQLIIYRWVHKILGTVNSSRVASITATTGICLLQNNVVCQEQRGAANGISTTAMSFFKSIAPIGAGALFSWAQKRQDATFLPGKLSMFYPC